MMGFSPGHLIIVLIVVVLVFGTGKLRSLGSDLGSAVKGFKKSMDDGESTPGPDQKNAVTRDSAEDERKNPPRH